MKTAIITILIGAASAFAPIQISKPTTQLNAASLALQPSTGGFSDPFAEKIANTGAFEPTTVFQSYGPAPVIEDLATVVDRAFSPAYVFAMKCVSSIGSLKKRSKTCQVVRRRGRIYVIDKKNPRNKVRQGGAKMKKRQKK